MRVVNFFKKAVKFLHGILTPLAMRLSTDEARAQFQQSLGFPANADDPKPDFPDGSAMENYLKNEEEKEDAVLLAQALAEAAQIIEALRGMYQIGAATYYGVKEDDTSQIEKAVSELVTMTINVFTLDYFRLKHPTLHNVFLMSGVVDEMGQRAGGSAFLGRVIVDYFRTWGKGFLLKDDEGIGNFMESIGLGLNILRFILFSDTKLFFSPGFETYPSSVTPVADKASKGMLSLGWYFQHDPDINGNLILTLGMIPKTRGGRGFVAKVNAPGSFEKKINDLFTLKVDAEGDLDFFFQDGQGFDAAPGQANRISIMAKLTPEPSALSLLDSPQLSIGYEKEQTLELRLSRDEIGFIVNATVNFKFGKGEATNFPFNLMPKSQFDETIPVSFGWTTRRDWFLSDSGTVGFPPTEPEEPANAAVARDAGEGSDTEDKANLFFFNVPIRTSLLGLSFQNIHMGLGKDGESNILEVSLDFTFVIGGAFQMAVTRLGVRGCATPVPDMQGYLGNDIDLDFKPPTGIGMTIDVGFLKGGGFLSLDREKGEYFGALELEVDLECFAFTIKAFGIIQTRLPGGEEGDYSLFVVISSEFEPVPLLFGLTLNGVGGLLGHNRTADLALLQSEMRSPGLENILFLKDPIANISRLVTESGRYFPVETDKSLLGFSMKIGYGKPTIMELKLAVIFIRPDKKILVPGFLHLETPRKGKILHLQVNFLAILDRKEGYFFFRADLVDSRLGAFKLAGSLVFATGWGASDGLFALSVGGFHPSYRHFPQITALPNAFKGLDRLRISLWEEGKNHLFIEAYLAITSNSRQIGAHAYLHVEGPMGFNIDGHLGFDVLWETEPICYFEANLEARVDFRHGKEVLAGVTLNGLYTGPTPNHIEGKAKLKICWFLSVSIPFSTTWGDPAPEEAVETADLIQLLIEQVEDDRNWRAETPDFHHLHVTIRTDPDRGEDEILIQPLGAILFSQREIPLEQEIEKVGVRKPKSAKKVKIDGISCAGMPFEDLKATRELFAAGNFFELSEDEKLARPPFEQMPSGVRIGDTATSEYPTPFIRAKDLEYELAYIAPDLPAQKGDARVLRKDQFQLLVRTASASQNKISWQSGRGMRTAPRPVRIKKPAFVIGKTDDLKVFTNGQSQGFFASSQNEAEQTMKDLLKEHPELKGKIQVLAQHELIN